jgi:tRNA modification GTPase
MNDTIAAIATATGIGSIAIVRVSGAKSLAIGKKLTKKDGFRPRYATLSKLYDTDDNFIDLSLIIYFKAPFSFTGEDVLEIQCHGGIIVANKILELCIEYGARLATGGEFSKRAFLNGKIDLTQAEAIAKLIESRSEEGLKILAKELDGELKRFVEKIREALIEILAYSEVYIDYAQEDIPSDLIFQIEKKLKNIQKNLRECVESSEIKKGLIDGFRISIIGKPNSGKSSLLNKMLKYERAIVSPIAGTTRDTVEENLKIGTHLVRIIDTAGIREAKNEIEKIGVKRSIKAIENSDVVIAMFDGSRKLEKEDYEILKLIDRYKNSKEFIVVINKIDLGEYFDENRFASFKIIKTSVKNDISAIMEELKNILDRNSTYEEALLFTQRQRDLVKKALVSIEGAYEPLKEEMLEIFSYHINEALEKIGQITSKAEYSEMLDKMFGEFCLGK